MVQGEEGEGKKSILDVDPEVQAMMEMAGKTLHSQGLREPEEDEDQWGTTGRQAPSSPGINTWCGILSCDMNTLGGTRLHFPCFTFSVDPQDTRLASFSGGKHELTPEKAVYRSVKSDLTTSHTIRTTSTAVQPSHVKK